MADARLDCAGFSCGTWEQCAAAAPCVPDSSAHDVAARLTEIEDEWLTHCPSCDDGTFEGECVCSEGDPIEVIAELVQIARDLL